MFKKKILIFVLLFLMILPASWSLFRPGFFTSDDGEWMVIRLSDFHRSIVSSQIPVRWAARLNYGYGYPVFNFLYPLSFYWGELFHLLGFSFVWSIKLVFIFSFILSAIFMFLFATEIFGVLGGLLSAIFYAYAPYRFLDVYVRGSLGEAVSFIFLPLIFWAIFKISQNPKGTYLTVGGVAFACLIMSHNIMALIFTPTVLAYIIFLFIKNKNKSFLILSFLFLILGFSLSCFFWLPAFYDKQFIILDKIKIANPLEHFPTPSQFLNPRWGYGPSVPGVTDRPSYQLGLIHLLGVVLSIFVLNSQTTIFLFIFIVAIFLMLPASSIFWQSLPLMNWIQFPWRLLAITTFTTAVLAGSIVQMFRPRLRSWLAAILLLLILLVNFRYARPEYFIDRGEGFYTTNEATTTVKDEYMPIWVKEKPVTRPASRMEVISGQAQIEPVFENSKLIRFVVEAKTGTEIQINTIYFPGWQVKVDNKRIPLNYDNDLGVMKIKVEPGQHQIIASFGETPLRLFADGVSLVSGLILAGLVIKYRRNEI